MPQYKIRDNQTGRTVTISGTSPPTEADMEGIFSQAGLRGGDASAPRPEVLDDTKGVAFRQQAQQPRGKSWLERQVSGVPGGLVQGAIADPLLGIAQIGARAVTDPFYNFITGFTGLKPGQKDPFGLSAERKKNPIVQLVDKATKAESEWYDKQRGETLGGHFDYPRVIGNIISPANYAGGAALGKLPKAVTLGGKVGRGILDGVISAGMQPVTDTENFGLEKAKQLGAGAIAGGTQRTLGHGLGRAFEGTKNKAVSLLNDMGVEMTPGQILRGPMKYMEDVATSWLGPVISGPRRASIESYNRALINRGLSSIGKSIPKETPAGHEAVDAAHRLIDDAYDAIKGKLTVKADQAFGANINNLRSMAQTSMLAERFAQFDQVLQNELKKFSQGGGITGDSFKAMDSELGRISRHYGRSQSGDERALGDAFREAQNQLRLLLERSNPAHAGELKNINRAYAQLVRVEDAAKAAKDGVFTPAQFQTATRKNDFSVRKNASARGKAFMQDMATAGREVLPSSVPDSGTVGRLLGPAAPAALALAAGGGGEALGIDPRLTAPAVGLGLLYTPAGRRAFQKAFVNTPGKTRFANELERLLGGGAPAAGMGAAGLLAGTER